MDFVKGCFGHNEFFSDGKSNEMNYKYSSFIVYHR